MLTGKSPTFEMFAGGPQRPQIRQLNDTVRLNAGQDTRHGDFGLRLRFLGVVQGDSQTAAGADKQHGSGKRAFHQHGGILAVGVAACGLAIRPAGLDYQRRRWPRTENI